jgi:hypothetical protein
MSEKFRDPLKDSLKAVEENLAERAQGGLGPTTHLLEQKTELEHALGFGFVKPAEPGAKPTPAPELEHAAADPPPETTTPRGPGRPRKPTDADRAAGS